MKSKTKYNLKSKFYKGTGLGVTGLGAVGGFVGYQAYNNWEQFQVEASQITMVAEESVKLNMFFALPMLIGFIVFYLVARKKNKDFFENKISINLLILVAVTYLVYSVVEITLFSLVGALGGSIIDELAFSPLSNRAKIKAIDEGELEMEETKEMIRIRARAKAKKTFDGSV